MVNVKETTTPPRRKMYAESHPWVFDVREELLTPEGRLTLVKKYARVNRVPC